jgi:hypothetical protein
VRQNSSVTTWVRSTFTPASSRPRVLDVADDPHGRDDGVEDLVLGLAARLDPRR